MALLSPGRFGSTDVVDVRVVGAPVAELPASLMVHVGSAAVAVRVRPLGVDTARLRLARALPLVVGDRAVLRDPGRRQVVGGVTVLDVVPPGLVRRGAAAGRAAVLAGLDGRVDAVGEVRRRRLVRAGDLARMGVPVTVAAVVGDWLADPAWWAGLGERLAGEVSRYAGEHPLEVGVPVEVLRRRLGLPDRVLVEALVGPPLWLRGGRVGAGAVSVLPEPVAAAVGRLREQLRGSPFRAPEADRLVGLGLGPREVGAAVRAGELVRLAENVVVLPGAVEEAARVLAGLPQPFSVSAARQALDSSRRVVVPLLELLDRRGVTRRLPDGERTVVAG
ncbi:SelB C-terminal domain-containing protein [Micromonospora cathayae]|uniref:SelB C-terminal domain-containing protein n=1 Tax=Micromonospora cathayae TaxID=3028804 RepID=A0ABY7ZJR1_9ACTN|nr:SelB C-terminal domain-containing protein [Micromonospora sp. HUAS 3]WDZ83185.1 SelB C-terminal domain-containing protein [Micromonospora sp. HUAS 3]